MTTEERLMNVGWQKLSHFAELTIFGRENQRILYAPQSDTIERVYSVSSYSTHLFELRFPTQIDFIIIFKDLKT